MGTADDTGMEDACWCDIILTADTDPARPDGGRADGLGSMDAYKSHCANDQNHIQSRNARLEIQVGTDSQIAFLMSHRGYRFQPRPPHLPQRHHPAAFPWHQLTT